ncbi:MAG: arginine--tRNA ligase [Bryobacterales bacterium]|nr:arginine--tRNA ligase [Bryobacterales bacterium]
MAGSPGLRIAPLAGAAASARPPSGNHIVEHTNINPNKAAHIGHLRNAVLGDTFVRMLRASGERVEVQNYIDNTGVQVADVVAGFHFVKEAAAEVQALIENPAIRFDYLCWDLYARVSANYTTSPETLAWRAETLHAIEADAGERAADRASGGRCHRRLATYATMLRLGIQYDVLPRESEILHLKFWARAFELLKERQAIYFEEKGKNKGCWVMPASAFRQTGGGAAEALEVAVDDATGGTGELAEAEAEDSKVIVRSNGTVTYVGKDIAYQLWKFGLLGQDFHYRLWTSLSRWPPHLREFQQCGRSSPFQRSCFRCRQARLQCNRFTPKLLAGCRGGRLACAPV